MVNKNKNISYILVKRNLTFELVLLKEDFKNLKKVVTYIFLYYFKVVYIE